MLSAIAVRAWACYDPPIATFVTAIFLIAAVLIGASNRETAQSFERVRLLDTAPLSLRESFEEAVRPKWSYARLHMCVRAHAYTYTFCEGVLACACAR